MIIIMQALVLRKAPFGAAGNGVARARSMKIAFSTPQLEQEGGRYGYAYASASGWSENEP